MKQAFRRKMYRQYARGKQGAHVNIRISGKRHVAPAKEKTRIFLRKEKA